MLAVGVDHFVLELAGLAVVPAAAGGGGEDLPNSQTYASRNR